MAPYFDDVLARKPGPGLQKPEPEDQACRPRSAFLNASRRLLVDCAIEQTKRLVLDSPLTLFLISGRIVRL
jgi:hypothetical protein